MISLSHNSRMHYLQHQQTLDAFCEGNHLYTLPLRCTICQNVAREGSSEAVNNWVILTVYTPTSRFLKRLLVGRLMYVQGMIAYELAIHGHIKMGTCDATTWSTR